MSINGIGTAGYPAAGYTARKAERSAESGTAGFLEIVAEKAEKTDWVKIVNDIMQSEYTYGDLKGYMEWKKFLGFLDK